MVTQGQKIAYLKKSNSDRQKFAPKLNIKFLQLTHVSRIKLSNKTTMLNDY